MTTAAWSVRVAIVDVLRANSALQTALGGTGSDHKVYGMRAPESAVAPYVVVGEPTEGSADAFGTNGNAGTRRIHVWAANAEPIAKLVDAALADARLALTGHTFVAGTIDLTILLVDPANIEHAVLTYRYATVEA